jgi:2-polyprenyl-3-methyl-5-hydroxy-6-metoxy-1,4-benzoquinol methylase
MILRNQNIIKDNKVDLKLLLDTAKKPDLFSIGEELFWDDPHISQQMLEAHLNPTWDAASYNHKTIDQTVEWLIKHLKLQEGSKILDLGCGPGLYCTRFSQRGLNVTGMDYSKSSIGYAVKNATENNMNIEYIYQNYLTMDYSNEFDAIFFIYCDFGALSDKNRDLLLQKIHKALKPNGVLVFDVFTNLNWEQPSACNWYACETGFWKPYQHLVLEQAFHYEEENVFLDQHTIIDNDGNLTTYKLWDHYYSVETISQVMEKNGYLVQDVWSDLTGKRYEDKSKKLGIVVTKK